MAGSILSVLGPSCRDGSRRAVLVENPGLGLNGIDFVEYRQQPPAGPGQAPRHFLDLHFLHPVPAGLYGLGGAAGLALIRIEGGSRITGVTATAAAQGADPAVLVVEVDRQGDFSVYVLAVGWLRQPDGAWTFALGGVDRPFSVAPVSFRAGCPVDFDCAPGEVCAEEAPEEPPLDYLARDYASFRQMLVDLVAQRNPSWQERNPADLGMALLELFAHEGDHLAYQQDAVANEATLDTARQRVSAKRHARLVDYAMHDGRNAWTFVQFEVDGIVPGPLSLGPGQLLLTEIGAPLRHDPAPPGVTLPETPPLDFDGDPALAGVRAFETATSLRATIPCNEIRLHAWGNARCCLPVGTRTAHLFSAWGPVQAVRPDVRPGDWLLLEEVRDPVTGSPARADPLHRQVVRIERADALTDPVYSDQLGPGGALQVRPAAALPLPLLEVAWRAEDALTFPLCLSSRLPDGDPIDRVSVARGNIALADHGRTVCDRDGRPGDELRDGESGEIPGDARVRLPLRRGPLTFQCQPDEIEHDRAGPSPTWRIITERPSLGCAPRAARPAVVLQVEGMPGGPQLWTPVPDLLASDEFDPHVVADVDGRGRATLRPGDGEYGRELAGATRIVAYYRVGNGREGNVGAEALKHLILPAGALPATLWVKRVRNPLPARDGTDPETIEEVRQRAPAAFRSGLERAVTADDYRRAAVGLDGVAGAVATFRWTGSWYTALAGIDPARPDDLVTEPGGRTRLAEDFERKVRAGLGRYRLAGYDLALRTARYVPLRVELLVCAKPGYFRGDVAHAVKEALTGQGGLFDPARLTFGDDVHASRLYAAVAAVEGVESVSIQRLERLDRGAAGELDTGVLPIGAWEIARLDDDPNRMENGVLVVTAGGGK